MLCYNEETETAKFQVSNIIYFQLTLIKKNWNKNVSWASTEPINLMNE